jgi:hypothetical protein
MTKTTTLIATRSSEKRCLNVLASVKTTTALLLVAGLELDSVDLSVQPNPQPTSKYDRFAVVATTRPVATVKPRKRAAKTLATV